MQKISIQDLDRARACVQWLMLKVGPVKSGNHGTLVRGEGWQYWVRYQDLSECVEVTIELNDHVDEDTQLLFALKWS